MLNNPLHATSDGAVGDHTASTSPVYRRFFDLSMDLVCLVTTEGRLMELNPSFQRTLGYTPDDLRGTLVLDLLHPDDLEASAQELGRLAKGIPTVAFENRLRHNGGGYVWVSWTVSPDDTGLLYAVGREVSEQKAAEKQLAIQTRWLKRAEEMAQVGHWRVDVAEGTVEWSDEVYRIHGRDPATYTPTLESGINAYHPDDRERVLNAVQAAMLGGEPFSFRLRIVQPGGAIRYVRSRGEVAKDEHGNVVSLFGVFMDVTDDHELRDALELSQTNFTSIFEAVPDAVVFFDAAFQVQLANPAFAFLFGFATPKAASGIHLRTLLTSPEAFHQLSTQSFTATHAADTLPAEFTFVREDDTAFAGELIGVAYGLPTASERGYLAVIRDVTERRANVSALKEYAHTLQQRNEELQQFAYIASHDLQEPLRTISSFTSLLAKRYKGQLDDPADEFIHYIVDAADRMQTLINDLLGYSRIGRWTPVITQVDTRAILNEVVQNLDATITQRNAIIEADDALPPITCDARMLRVLLTNLLNNALKYNTSETPLLQIRVEVGEHEEVLTVQDNGIGIEPRFQQRIFEMFKRLHGRGEYSGTGIGLAVCKKIMEAHKGAIWVESVPGEGATFYAAFRHDAA